MPFQFTNRAGRVVITTFEINDFLKYREENPTLTWAVPPSNENHSVAKQFGLDYQGQAQLRESTEYKDAVEAYVGDNSDNISIFAIKTPQQARESSGITKDGRASIGEKVLMFLEGQVSEDDDGQATQDWVSENIEILFELGKDNGFGVTKRPDKVARKTSGGPTKAQIQQDLEAKEEALAAAQAKLAEMGIEL